MQEASKALSYANADIKVSEKAKEAMNESINNGHRAIDINNLDSFTLKEIKELDKKFEKPKEYTLKTWR